MKKIFLLASAVLTLAGAVGVAQAGTIVKGMPANGVYWGMEKGPLGRAYYECFDQKSNKKTDKQRCIDAKAEKPVTSPK